MSRDGDQLRAVVVAGQEHLTERWSVCWVTVPRGAERGPSAQGAAETGELVLTIA